MNPPVQLLQQLAPKEKWFVGRFRATWQTATECHSKGIGVDEIEIRSMYESGKLSKVAASQLSAMVPSEQRIHSWLLSNSK
jgi:hypothetical protein